MDMPLSRFADPTRRWVDAPTRTVSAAGNTFAYRQLGPADGVPVLLLNHWGANLDNFDPPYAEFPHEGGKDAWWNCLSMQLQLFRTGIPGSDSITANGPPTRSMGVG